MSSDQQKNQFNISAGKITASSITLRSIYQELGHFLQNKKILNSYYSHESFAECRRYAEAHVDRFDEVYHFLPANLFQTSSDIAKNNEILFWDQFLRNECQMIVQATDRSDPEIGLVPQHFFSENKTFLLGGAIKNKLSRLEEGAPGETHNQQEFGDRGFFYRLGYTLLGPVLMTYGLWVRETSKGNPVRGLMRDGKFLSRVCSELGIKTKENVYISRLSSIKASLANPIDNEGLINFLYRANVSNPLTMKQAADHLGLFDDFDFPINQSEFLGEGNINRVIKWANEKKIREQRLASACENLKGLQAHLDLTGVLEDSRVIFLDLGYAGNILANLKSIYDYVNCSQEIRGRFLLSSVGSLWAQKKDVEILGCLIQNGAPYSKAKVFFRTPELLELCCACEEGTTIGYQNDGKPITAPPPLPGRQYRQIKELQEGVIQYIRDHKGPYDGSSPSMEMLNNMRSAAAKSLFELLEEPNFEQASLLGSWKYDHSDGEELYELNNLHTNTPIEQAGRRDIYWPQAYRVLDHHG